MALLGEESCEKCKFIWADGPNGWCCRWDPPTSHIVTMVGPNGQPATAEVSKFRKVEPTMWCGQYKPRIMSAREIQA